MHRVLVVAVLLLLLCPVSAAQPQAIAVGNAQTFRQQAEEVRRQLRSETRFGHLDPGRQRSVEAELDRMEALLLAHGSIKAMDPRDRIALFNAQERINAALASREEKRLVCRRERRIGSNMSDRICRPVGDSDATRDRHQDFMRRDDAHRWNMMEDN